MASTWSNDIYLAECYATERNSFVSITDFDLVYKRFKTMNGKKDVRSILMFAIS